jgi:hypothetical protein
MQGCPTIKTGRQEYFGGGILGFELGASCLFGRYKQAPTILALVVFK